MMNETNSHVIAIRLAQTGVRGPVSMNVEVTGPDSGGPLPEVYSLGNYLVNFTRHLVAELEDRIEEPNGVLYTATFELQQPADEEIFYSKMTFNPLVAKVDGVFADVHTIMNTVATAYLESIGMLDEEGNIVPDDERLENIDVQVSQNPTRH